MDQSRGEVLGPGFIVEPFRQMEPIPEGDFGQYRCHDLGHPEGGNTIVGSPEEIDHQPPPGLSRVDVNIEWGRVIDICHRSHWAL